MRFFERLHGAIEILKLVLTDNRPTEALRQLSLAVRPFPIFAIALGAALVVWGVNRDVDLTSAFYTCLIAAAVVYGWKRWGPALGANLDWRFVLGSILLGIALPIALVGISVAIVNTAHAHLPPAVAAPPTYYLGLFAAPIAETILFQFWLQNRFGPVVAAIAFILVHMTLQPSIIGLGVALGFVQRRTGSVVCTILTHAVFNATMYWLWLRLAKPH